MLVLLKKFCVQYQLSIRIMRRDHSDAIVPSGGQDWLNTEIYYGKLTTDGKRSKKSHKSILETNDIRAKKMRLKNLPRLIASTKADIQQLEFKLKNTPAGSEWAKLDLDLHDMRKKLQTFIDQESILNQQIQDLEEKDLLQRMNLRQQEEQSPAKPEGKVQKSGKGK